jgi:hypothetical protein
MAFMASPSEGQQYLEEDSYVRACPDYKRYSMFMQYVLRKFPGTTANSPQPTVLRRRDAIALPAPRDPLSNVHVPAGGEGY